MSEALNEEYFISQIAVMRTNGGAIATFFTRLDKDKEFADSYLGFLAQGNLQAERALSTLRPAIRRGEMAQQHERGYWNHFQLSLGVLNIRGKDIGAFYEGFCSQDHRDGAAVMSACLMGIVTLSSLQSALADIRRGKPHTLDLPGIKEEMKAARRAAETAVPREPVRSQDIRREEKRF